MAKKLMWDRTLLLAVLGLITIGIPMVFSSSALIAQKLGKSPYFFLTRQLIWAFLGFVIMMFFLFIDYIYLKSKFINWGSLVFAAGMLTYVLFSSASIKRWMRIGGFSFQPSEFAKVAVVLFLAYSLQNVTLPIRLKKVLFVSMPVVIIVALIVVEPDLGTGFLIALVLMTMLFIVGLDKKYIALFGIVGIILLMVTVQLYNYRMDRLNAWWNQIKGVQEQGTDTAAAAFQLEQAKIAVGSGGIQGLGFGNSLQKLFYLPQPHNDFIFSILAEELGLMGTISIWLLYLFIFIKGMMIAKRFPDRYGSYVALGVTLMLIYQSLINISVVLGLMPTKGIPLPFISSGGSSLMMSLLSVGILLNLSQHISKE
ncbi:MAG: hypothetical protein A2Y62_17135 [Candidatus Fischerbacteria bacterium RBG_13_37_8]|uniref:Probable peptidoglycan glycosyltransferase FtsW n=1 Tax=Candidatus Fischerbacteria bacterium RBG_13_37_8 TaxID=1817863 RepID=A0A1F5VG06_9BACT|nr:MAG: hypothetical protein A2Y62_17135 [Candidatus Fischerbacteria bacterium RBG_13_37_8]